MSANKTRILSHPLAVVRADNGWTLQRVAEIISLRMSKTAWKGQSHRQIPSRWERCGVIPELPQQYALADELGISHEIVRRAGWPYWLPAGPQINTAIPWTAESALHLLEATGGDTMTDRRGFMLVGATALATTLHDWIAIDSPRLEHALNSRRVDETLVDCFERRLPGLRSMDQSLGGGSVRKVVDAELQLVTDLLRNGSYTELVAHRLYSVTAELCKIAGWASFDTGYHAAAERYWHSGLRSAHTAGDHIRGANILKCMSLQRMDGGQPRQALAIAATARDGVHRTAPARVQAMLACRQARTHAALGERRECEVLLATAETAMMRADKEPVPDWAAYFDLAEYCAQVASCYLILNEYDQADQWLEQTIAMQPNIRSRDRATYLMWRAEANHGLGNIDLACDLVVQAVPDIVPARSARNVDRLNTIHQKLIKHRTAAVDGLTAQLQDLINL